MEAAIFALFFIEQTDIFVGQHVWFNNISMYTPLTTSTAMYVYIH